MTLRLPLAVVCRRGAAGLDADQAVSLLVVLNLRHRHGRHTPQEFDGIPRQLTQ